MNDPLHTSPLQFRVLIVDNSSDSRNSNKVVVDALDYESVVALGEGKALQEDAKFKARQKRCHLALVDMRLVDDRDPSDKSGLELIPFLSPTRSLVVSGSDEGKDRTDAETMNQARDKGAVGYAKKGDPALHTKILEVLWKFWNWNLTYDFAKTRYNQEGILARLDLHEAEQISPDEVDNLLRQSYNSGEVTLDLESLEGPYDSSDSTTSLRRSVVLFAEASTEDEGIQKREIIKFAPRDHVEQEASNYHKYVGHLDHQYTALFKHDPVVSWDIGIIRYTNETAGERKRFTEWYWDNSYARVKQAIQHLFSQVLKSWYDRDQGDQGKSRDTVYEYYTRPDPFRKLGPQIDNFPNPDDTLCIYSLPGTFVNPVRWAKAHKDQSRFPSRWRTLIHGDLHSGNIIVDRDARTCIIDYERTGLGYYLRDFVELEKDIRLRLLKLDAVQLELALHLDCLLMGQEQVDRLPVWQEPSKGSASESAAVDLRKAFEAICAVRQAVAEVGGLEYMDEYYWALLMETLLSVTDPRVTGFAYQRAILSASLICERLERWRNPRNKWPPQKRCGHLVTPAAIESEISQISIPVSHRELSKMHNYALLIGVGETSHDPPSSLPTTVKDTEALKGILLDPSRCAYSPQNVRVLSNETASLPQIRDELKWLADQAAANPDATVIVYFSGHGGHLRADGRYFLVPSNVEPDNIEGTALWATEFTERLSAIKAKRVLVLVDACHAAGMATAKDVSLLRSSGFIETPPPDDLLKSWQQSHRAGQTKHAITAPSQGEGRVVISSSRGDQSSYIRRDGTLSIFTYHLREALRGDASKPNDTAVTVSTLISHLGKTVPASANADWGAQQRPWIDYAGEDFPIASLGRNRKNPLTLEPGADSPSSPEPGSNPGQPITLFYAYSHKDEKLRDRLEKHLSILKHQRVISNWHDRRITAGTEWKGEIDDRLNSAGIILLLVSADFLASDYCYDVEMKRALERHKGGAARVIPVVLRSVDWKGAPFGELLALPQDAKPVMEWKPSDKGFEDIARGIRVAVEQLQASRP